MKSSARNSLKRLTSLNWSEWKKSLLSCSRIARSSVDCLVSFISCSFSVVQRSLSRSCRFGAEYAVPKCEGCLSLFSVDPSRRLTDKVAISFAPQRRPAVTHADQRGTTSRGGAAKDGEPTRQHALDRKNDPAALARLGHRSSSARF